MQKKLSFVIASSLILSFAAVLSVYASDTDNMDTQASDIMPDYKEVLAINSNLIGILDTNGPFTIRILAPKYEAEPKRKISKTYMADLRGDFKTLGIPEKGRIALPISPDYIDRPPAESGF